MNELPPTASPADSSAPPAPQQAAAAFQPASDAWRNPWLWVAVAGIVLAGWQWLETRARLADTQQEVARRLAEGEASGKEDRGALKLAQEQLSAVQAKLGALEAKQAEFQGQTQELQGLYQELARTRLESTLLEVEQAVTLAAQQLQLAGNVRAAVLALQAADARLARLDRPQFIPLRKALARDIDRLRALPFVDVPGISVKLENLILGIEALPLAMDERPRQPERSAPLAVAPDAPWWQRLGEEIGRELRGLVRIQRIDRVEPVLLAPGQVFFLRENLKLRLLNARLALLAHDTWTFRNELRVAQDWLGRHFDAQDKRVQDAQASLKQLAGTELSVELPNLNDSLNAVGALRSDKDKK